MSTQINPFRYVDGKYKTMIMQNCGGQKVIELIITSYGFTSRQAFFCKHLVISQSIMANRYVRDTFPADWVLLCTIETSAPIEWLSFSSESSTSELFSPGAPAQIHSVIDDYVHSNKNPIETNINPNQGGKAAIKRLIDVIGFTAKQALADHLDVSKSTLANRYLQDTFPADWIVRHTLDAGTSLQWLLSGIGAACSISKESDTIPLKNHSTTNVAMIKQKSSLMGFI